MFQLVPLLFSVVKLFSYISGFAALSKCRLGWTAPFSYGIGDAKARFHQISTVYVGLEHVKSAGIDLLHIGTRGLFWDGPLNFEPQSDDEDDTSAGTPFSKLPRQREEFWQLRMIYSATGPIRGGSSVESGFEPGVLWPQGRDPTIRPPRPHVDSVWKPDSGC
ncbi:hypothetical protein AVEN_150760-1 [Araneus ventricosus]|uniref:Uncharacterized protein n=1 Tax=Araneus ventricosus TaxID=182803 RepID=A0A4Y2KXK4_ARAVE|nr:hypothetical protein AVEN_150760-1 [Araneus ventricosus]